MLLPTKQYPVRYMLRQGIRQYRYYSECRDFRTAFKIKRAVKEAFPKRERMGKQLTEDRRI